MKYTDRVPMKCKGITHVKIKNFGRQMHLGNIVETTAYIVRNNLVSKEELAAALPSGIECKYNKAYQMIYLYNDVDNNLNKLFSDAETIKQHSFSKIELLDALMTIALKKLDAAKNQQLLHTAANSSAVAQVGQ